MNKTLSFSDPFMEDVFTAARTNDCERLISVLLDPKNCDQYYRYKQVDDLWALETALHHGNKEAANILACYQILGLSHIQYKKPHEIIASKSIWCQCLQNAIIQLIKSTSKSFRARRGYKQYLYLKHNDLPQKLPDDLHPFYYIVKDHYSKLLTPFDAIEYPSAFMALLRLDDDADSFRILSPEGYTLPMHILMSKNVIKNHKLAMLNFLADFDPEVLYYTPCGPEGLTPAVYCLKSNNVFLFNTLFRWSNNVLSFRSTDGKDIMSYCTNKHLTMFSEEERKQLYIEHDGALSTFLIRNMTGREKRKFHDLLVFEAIETLYKNGKQVQLQRFANVVTDKVFGTFLVQTGYSCENLEQFRYHSSAVVEKENVKTDLDLQTTFEFVNLPQEMLELIMAMLFLYDIINLFSVTKTMHQWFKSFNSSALWKQISNNNRKISLDGDIPKPTSDYKKYIIDTECCQRNWRQGKFREKVLLDSHDHITDTLIDDNWLLARTIQKNLHVVNMHTDEKLTFGLASHTYGTLCIVESPHLSPPLVAMYTKQGCLYYGRPGPHSITHVIQVPVTPQDTNFIDMQTQDRVVVSSRLQVVDLNTQRVITSTEGVHVRDAKVNVFNRSMVIGRDYSTVRIYDKDMLPVQTMALYTSTNYGMIDEFNLALGTSGQILLFDIRKLDPQNYPALIGSDQTQVNRANFDVRNQRALVEYGPLQMIAQIDLKTRQWERVWKPMGTRTLSFPLLNDRYIVRHESKKLLAFDFN